MFRANRLIAGILGCTVLLLGTAANAEQLLRWKFKAGETLKVELIQKSEIETTIANKPLKMNDEMVMEMAWQVESVDEQGTARLAQSFTRLRRKIEMQRQDPIEYDSAAKTKPAGPAKEIAAGIDPLIGVKFHVTMNSRGEISEVKLSDEAAKALEGAAARSKDAFTKERVTEILRQSAVVLPEQPVEKGTEWSIETTSKTQRGSIKLSNKYTYVGTEERAGKMLEKIGVETTLEFSEPKGKPEIKEQKHSGLLYFDAAAGRFV